MIYVKEKNNKTSVLEKPGSPAEKACKKPLSPLLALPLAAVLFLLFLLFPSESSKGTSEGINLCINTLLPSLFPFMFVSALFTSAISFHSNAHAPKSSVKSLCHPSSLTSSTKKRKMINWTCIQTLILAAFGGYPVGASTVNGLYKKGLLSPMQSRLMIYTAFGGGMGFLVSYTGAALLSSREAGFLLFTSQLISMALLTLSAFAFSSRKKRLYKAADTIETAGEAFSKSSLENIKEIQNTQKYKDSAEKEGIPSILISSALSAGKSAANMCLIVILFSAVSGIILPSVSYNSILRDCFYGLWEVSAGVKNLAPSYPLWITGFITGFGGICVHTQVFYAAKDVSFSKGIFMAFRLAQGLLNGSIVFIMSLIFPVEETAFSVFSSISESPSPAEGENPLKLLILVFACFCFLFSLGQKLCMPKPIILIKEKLNNINRR